VTEETNDHVHLATELTIAWLSNGNTRASAEEVPDFLTKMHQAVSSLSNSPAVEAEPAQPEYVPAVTARKSLASPEHIVSMIDGKPYKSLKRHLGTHGMTPAEYRQRYGLKAEYPMVAPAYAETRRALAKKIGLGRKPGQKVGGGAGAAKGADAPAAAESAAPAAAAKPAPKRRRAKAGAADQG
jgi:predicted transcriptional regulator